MRCFENRDGGAVLSVDTLPPHVAAISAMMKRTDLPTTPAPHKIATIVSPELEAMITRIVREQLDLAKMEAVTPRGRYAPTIALCIRLTAEEFGRTVKGILGDGRQAKIVEARHAAMWLAFKASGQSVSEIGRRFGRDHSTVLHGIAHAEKLRAADVDFADLTTALIGNFKVVV